MKTGKPRPRPPARQATTTASPGRALWGWAALALPVVGLLALVIFGGGESTDGAAATGSVAPAFDLPATDGSRQTLDGALAEGDALLYFSMGPGCDGCFAQIPEIEDALAERGINLVPVMVDPAPIVAAEAARFGIATPILIDADRSVSAAYDMIGVYGHQDRPSHSFALVSGEDARIAWIRHYAEMFVPMDRFLADLAAAESGASEGSP